MSRSKCLLNWVAGLSIGAVVAHAIDTPDHLNEWWGYATFFVVIAAIQFFLGVVLLLRPWQYDESGKPRDEADRYGQSYYKFGILLAASIIVMYIISRTTGLPFLGPDAAPETVTPLSLVPVLENVPSIYCFAVLVRRTRERSPEHLGIT